MSGILDKHSPEGLEAMLTRAADYAARVMIHLATLPSGTRVQRTVLAEATDVPESFMSKVLQGLVRVRFISSKSGVNGGFELTANPEKLSLLDVVEAIDGPLEVNVCVTHGQSCERQRWCAAHLVWVEAQEAFTKVLRSTNIRRLAQQTTALRAAANAAGSGNNASGSGLSIAASDDEAGI